jgi:Reverse transcriptase (RNA-dependent DNA polymerase)
VLLLLVLLLLVLGQAVCLGRCGRRTVTLEHWHISSVDIKTAFLYRELDEELYMEQPEGFKTRGQEHKVLCLKHTIYGLCQAALQWWKALDKSMASIGFKCLQSDSGIFFYKDKGDLVIVVVYVDDALFLGSNLPLVNKLKSLFMKRWECCDLGNTKEFLHMCIIHKQGMIFLD